MYPQHGKNRWPILVDVSANQVRFATCFVSTAGGGRKRLPKFKFSAKFPIGLHVILQIQIKKFEIDCYIM